MSTTALHIIGLVKSLPLKEQEGIRDGLNRPLPPRDEGEQRLFLRDAQGNYYNAEGIANDHPFFKILEEDEAARRQDSGPPPPEFD